MHEDTLKEKEIIFRPSVIDHPRSCYCGYQLKPGEQSYYFMGRWICPRCCSGERARPWENREGDK